MFDQREGETPQEWLARLEAIDPAGLSMHQRIHLSHRKDQARALIVSRPGTSSTRQTESLPRPRLPSEPAAAPKPLDPLDAIKADYRQLTGEQRQQFILWLSQGAKD